MSMFFQESLAVYKKIVYKLNNIKIPIYYKLLHLNIKIILDKLITYIFKYRFKSTININHELSHLLSFSIVAKSRQTINRR